MRGLHYVNLIGVLLLAVLCGVQWKANRELNLRTNEIEKIRIEQIQRIEEQAKQIKGQAADLDSFREHLRIATTQLKSAESNLLVARQDLALLTTERDQLKESIVGWTKAVAERDEKLSQISKQVEKLAADRNDAVVKFNELAKKHNDVVDALNARTGEFNSLVERYNALSKAGSQAAK